MWSPFIPPCAPSRRYSGWKAALSPISLMQWGLWDKATQEVLSAVFLNLLRLSQASVSGQSQFKPVLSQTTMVKNSKCSKYPAVGKQERWICISSRGIVNYQRKHQGSCGQGQGQGVLDYYPVTYLFCLLVWPAERLSAPFIMKCSSSTSSKDSQSSPGLSKYLCNFLRICVPPLCGCIPLNLGLWLQLCRNTHPEVNLSAHVWIWDAHRQWPELLGKYPGHQLARAVWSTAVSQLSVRC